MPDNAVGTCFSSRDKLEETVTFIILYLKDALNTRSIPVSSSDNSQFTVFIQKNQALNQIPFLLACCEPMIIVLAALSTSWRGDGSQQLQKGVNTLQCLLRRVAQHSHTLLHKLHRRCTSQLSIRLVS